MGAVETLPYLRKENLVLTYEQRDKLADIRHDIFSLNDLYNGSVIIDEVTIKTLHHDICDIYVKISDLAMEIEHENND